MNQRNTKLEATKILRCAIYTRKSTEEGLDQEFNSLDAQREAGESYIMSQRHEGWECVSTQYDDGGFTGANMERPGLRRLLADIEAGIINCVVVYKVDRLSRSLLDFTKIIEIFDRHKVAFVSVTQAFNTASSMGRLILNVLLSFAQFEREMISERTRDKMAAARRKGKWVGGMPILGYNVQNSKLVVDPIESIRVREIFELYLDLKSSLAVAKEINGRGWRKKQWTTKKGTQVGGSEFNKNAICSMLVNPTYVGKIEYKGELYPGEHQGIVDQGTFDRAQELLNVNSRIRGRTGRCKHNALLQGMLRCSACGCGMSHSFTKKGSRLYRYYICHKAQKQGWATCPSPSLPANEIEEFVIGQIRGLGEDPSVIRDTLAQTRIQTHQQSGRLKQEKNALEGVIRGDYRRLNAAVSAKSGEAAMANLQSEIQEHERRLSEVVADLKTVTTLLINENDVREALGNFDEVWNILSPLERTKVMQQIVDHVSYDGHTNNLSITYQPIGIMTFGNEYAAAEGSAEC